MIFFLTFNYTPKPPLLAAEPNNFLQAEKPPKNGLAEKRLSRKTAEIYFSAIRRKNFSLNMHYDEIIFDSPAFFSQNKN